MNDYSRSDYINRKKCLLVLLYIYYAQNIDYNSLVLVSFGFHFDPSCTFKSIISTQEEEKKHIVHIVSKGEKNNIDKKDFINIYEVDDVFTFKTKEPKRGLYIYFDGYNFIANGYLDGKHIEFKSKLNRKHNTGELVTYLEKESLKTHNDTARTFTIWLAKFFTHNISTDLVIGAGINEDYGAKNWDGLITALNDEFYSGSTLSQKQISHYVGKELFTNSMVLKTSGFDIYNSLNKELYEFKEAKSFNDSTSTLYNLVSYIKSREHISVITYNYDTNLEYLLRKQNIYYVTIYDDYAFNNKVCQVDIYHVHGLLPYNCQQQKKFTNSIILNESDYFYLYNNPYSWSISKQLHDFKFNTCIFIGISLTDPDMKRLLELARNPLKFNFIFIKKEKDYPDSVFKDITTYFFTYDLITIWIDDYSEIDSFLKEIQ